MAEAKDDIVLSIRGMCKSFGRNRVLDHINLDVKRGTVMGLMGENGAGKSTMMKCLFGTYQKDEGKIFLNAHVRRVREKIETDPSKPVSLITIKGLGYKLIARK